MIRVTNWVLMITATGLFACGGIPTPRISEVESTTKTNNSLTIDTTEVEYLSSGKIDVINFVEDGKVLVHVEFSYSGDKIKGMDLIAEETGDLLKEVTLDYKGDKLDTETLVVPDPAGTNDVTTTAEYKYDGDRLTDVTITADSPALTKPLVSTLEYRYNDKKQVEKQTYFDSDQSTWVTKYEYDADNDNRLDKVTETDPNGDTTNINFSYGEDGDAKGRVEKVSVTGASFTVTYKNERVEQVEAKYGATDTTTDLYSYKDGDVVGMIPSPGLPFGDLFDISGKQLEKLEPLSSGNLFSVLD